MNNGPGTGDHRDWIYHPFLQLVLVSHKIVANNIVFYTCFTLPSEVLPIMTRSPQTAHSRRQRQPKFVFRIIELPLCSRPARPLGPILADRTTQHSHWAAAAEYCLHPQISVYLNILSVVPSQLRLSIRNLISFSRILSAFLPRQTQIQ